MKLVSGENRWQQSIGEGTTWFGTNIISCILRYTTTSCRVFKSLVSQSHMSAQALTKPCQICNCFLALRFASTLPGPRFSLDQVTCKIKEMQIMTLLGVIMKAAWLMLQSNRSFWGCVRWPRVCRLLPTKARLSFTLPASPEHVVSNFNIYFDTMKKGCGRKVADKIKTSPIKRITCVVWKEKEETMQWKDSPE